MSEIEDIAQNIIANTPEWVLRYMAQSEGHLSCFVYGRFPDEGMTWRSNMVEALGDAIAAQ